jgi:hypothetical protein
MGCAMKKAIISLILLLSLVLPTLAAMTSELRPDAPDRYTVVPGDTLWGIATRFLKDPWRWPELWGMNQAQVRNPHRIYPGDVLVLDRSVPGQATLRLDTARLSPQIRVEPREADAIRSIPPTAIEPFLSKPLVVSANELAGAAEIVATEEDRVILGGGSKAYARGLATNGIVRWHIVRRGDPLVDPETNESLGYMALYLGEAELLRAGEISTIGIAKAVQEIYRGDKLIPIPPIPPVFAYVPHAPTTPIRGRVVSTYAGLWETGPLSIITLSKGHRDGLEVGHVLAISRDARSARYAARTQAQWGRTGPTGSDKPNAYYSPELDVRHGPMSSRGTLVRESDFEKLPNERYGLVMVFRTFERASYGLVMQASRPVAVTDIVSNP